MNNITISGFLTRDPVVSRTTTEKMVASGTVAVARTFKTNAECDTDFFDFEVWENQAEYLVRYGHKGVRVEIVGSMECQKFTKKDGTIAKNWKIRVSYISVFSKQQGEQTKQDKVDDEDLPF